MGINEGPYRLEFDGFESESAEGLQRFKAVCLATLELSIEDTVQVLSGSGTRILRMASSIEDLKAVYEALRATGARVAIIGPHAVEDERETAPERTPSRVQEDDEECDELTFELEDLLESHLSPSSKSSAEPKEYFLDLDGPESSLGTSSGDDDLDQDVEEALLSLSSSTVGTSEFDEESDSLEDDQYAEENSEQDDLTSHAGRELEIGPPPIELEADHKAALTFDDESLHVDAAASEVLEEMSALLNSAQHNAPFSLASSKDGDSEDLAAILEQKAPIVAAAPAKEPSPAVAAITLEEPSTRQETPSPPVSSTSAAPDAQKSAPTAAPTQDEPSAHAATQAVTSVSASITRIDANPAKLADLAIAATSKKHLPLYEDAEYLGSATQYEGGRGSGSLTRRQLAAIIFGGMVLIVAVNWVMMPKVIETQIPTLPIEAPKDESTQAAKRGAKGERLIIGPTLAGESSDEAHTVRVTVSMSEAPSVKITITTPQPADLTPEEIGKKIAPRPWLRRVETEGTTLKQSGPNTWSGALPAYIFVERGQERRRLGGSALVSVTLTPDEKRGEAEIELSYSPPGDDRLPPPGTVISTLSDGFYSVAVSAKVSLKRQ